ncbi:MAG: hypothetical protein KC910_02835 [Candidatus Eremiobacteraeota bacterium]|nr:hypothetical protein [Candidatus Eremiobacteraeota bacterium]
MSGFSSFAVASFQMKKLAEGAVAFSFHEQADSFAESLDDGIVLSPQALAFLHDEE